MNTKENGHPRSERLSDYVDGELGPAERERIEAHAATCEACASVLADLRTVVERARGAGDGPPPPAGLWRGIAPRLAPRPEPWWRRGVGPAGWRWAAQAAALAVVCVAGVIWLAQNRTQPPVPLASSPVASGVAVMAPDREYDDRVAGLLHVVRARLTHDPQVLAVLEQNLQAMDVAIADYRDLLAARPADPRIRDRVTAVRERKLDLLERAAALAEVTD
jgi:anti-sigma factor RsiW